MIRAFDLDFIGNSRKRKWNRVFAIVLVCLSGLAIWLGNRYVRASADIDKLRAEAALQVAARPTSVAPDLTPKQREALEAEAKQVRTVAGKLSTPWDSLFRIVESTVDDDTVLLTLEPQADLGNVQITAETRSFSTMLEYLERLKQATALHEVYIASHEVQLQDSQHPIRFVVNAKWDTGYRDDHVSQEK